jgi:hypothetical protein
MRFLTSILFVVALPAAGASQEPAVDRALLVLLDVSGSMREPVRGGIKNTLAVKGMFQALDALPPDTHVGLRLMGEGGEGCESTQAAIAIGPYARPRWQSAIDGLAWKGETPLVFSMRTALADLNAVNARQRELLIIGDGDETCGEDPVGVALREANGIPIHGISLGEDVSHQLAGIALVTGGTYSRAFDDDTFIEALTRSTARLARPAATVPNAAQRRVEIILDMSNSMWGRVDGRPRVELAREALTTALADFPPTVPVGLRAYGHRIAVDDKAAGCEDTERLIPPAAGTAAQILAAARELTPRGHTPIARSLLETADDLRREGGAATIVLISDGIESCGGNPEQVMADLRASGLPVILHTVGLTLGSADAEQLAALAGAGGGIALDAGDADALGEAVRTAIKTGSDFVLANDVVERYPRNVIRVGGGTRPDEMQALEAGTYAFTEHMFREQRYFAVRGTPGQSVTVRGMVGALEIGRTRAGVVTYQGRPNMMFINRVDASGERLRGSGLSVRGDMGTWASMTVQVEADGFARFRIERLQGAIHRDMIFQISK